MGPAMVSASLANISTHGPIVKPEPIDSRSATAPPRKSSDYAFCFAGAGYDHGIPVEYQSDYWLPCPRFRITELNSDAEPFSAQHAIWHIDPSVFEDTETYLWVGMAIEPRLGICVHDPRAGDDGNIFNTTIRRLEPRRDKAYPVIVRTQRGEHVRLVVYALVELEGHDGDWEARKVRPEEVFFFTPYRDTADLIRCPVERRKAWYKKIKEALGITQECAQVVSQAYVTESMGETEDENEDMDEGVSQSDEVGSAEGDREDENASRGASPDKSEEDEDEMMRLDNVEDDEEEPVVKRRSKRRAARPRDYMGSPAP